jgi:hypothetical protein
MPLRPLSAMSSSGGQPALLVFADSLSYFGPRGALPADHPQIWPTLVADALGWRLELIARIGWTARDAYWALTQDPRAWAAVPHAGAVVLAVGGMDSLPSPLPTALREQIRYLRPAKLRRAARTAYNAVQPKASRLGWPVALPPRVSAGYLEKSRSALRALRPDLPVIGTLPPVHRSAAYGGFHQGREPQVAAVRDWAAGAHVPLVDLGATVREHVLGGRGNPDGIHWGFEAHRLVADAMLAALEPLTAPVSAEPKES